MAFRSVQVPAAAETANRDPIVDFWKKSHDNAIHSFVQVIASLAGCSGVFSARLDRHRPGVWAAGGAWRMLTILVDDDGAGR
jgi:hypothetical protein